MSEQETGICPGCGEPVELTPRAKKISKHEVNGAVCPGSGEFPATAQDEPPVDVADEDEWPDEAGDETPDESVEPTVDEPDAGPQPPEPDAEQENSGPTYDWKLKIRQPALYLDDAGWHQSNAIAAGRAAEAAGHVPAGEGRCTNLAATQDEGGLELTYSVPIEEKPHG